MRLALLIAALSMTWISCQTIETRPTTDTEETFPETPPISEDILPMRIDHGFRMLHLDGSVKAENVLPLIRVLGSHGGIRGFIIEINNTGGDVGMGLALSKAIEHAGVPIHCVVDGEAQSMAFYILQSCTTRSMTRRSILMVHNPAITTAGSARFTSREAEEMSDSLVALQNGMIEQYIRRMKVTKKEMQDKLAVHNWYLGWEDATKYGAVDHVYFSIDEVLVMAMAWK